MTVEVWKVTFTAIFLRNIVVHSVFCVFARRCMYHCVYIYIYICYISGFIVIDLKVLDEEIFVGFLPYL